MNNYPPLPPGARAPRFPFNLLKKTVTFRIDGNVTVTGEGELLAIEEFYDKKYFLKIGQNGRAVYINTEHIVSIEEKDQ